MSPVGQIWPTGEEELAPQAVTSPGHLAATQSQQGDAGDLPKELSQLREPQAASQRDTFAHIEEL